MNNYEQIIEYKNVITKFICDDIIELFDEVTEKNNEELYIKKNIDKEILGTITTSIFNIPKNNNEWNKIELLLYKEILNKLNNYKNKLLITKENDFKNNLIKKLNEDMYLNHFCIQKINNKSNNITFINSQETNEKIIIKRGYNRINSRNTLLNFILFLNTVKNGGIIFDNEYIINSEECKLVIIPDDTNYIYDYIYSITNEQYIITGQIYNKNIINIK